MDRGSFAAASSFLQLYGFLRLRLFQGHLCCRILHQGVQLLTCGFPGLNGLFLRSPGLLGLHHRLQIPVRNVGFRILPDVLSGFILPHQGRLGHCGLAVCRDLSPESFAVLVLVHCLGRKHKGCPGSLAFGYILPATGRIRDLHLLETCAARRTKNGPANQVFAGPYHCTEL